MFRVAIIACMLYLVYGQPKFCCYPTQWEGAEGSTTGSADDEGHTALTVGNSNVAYDVTGQRFYIDQKLESGNISRAYTILQLYQQKVEYIIENGRCTRIPLKPYINTTNCIPDNATVMARYMLGRKENMMVTEYMWNLGQLTVMLTVNDDCVPVVSKSYGNVNGDDIMQGQGYLGITPGIKDDKIFNIPSICSGVLEQQAPAEGNTGPIFLYPLRK